MATCLREAAPAKAGNAAGGFFQQTLIDKCRALHHGTLGDFIYPCPLDQCLLDFVGLIAQVFLEGVKEKSEEDCARWIHQMATPRTPAEMEDWNQRFVAKRPETEEQHRYFDTVRDDIDPTRTDITSWDDLLDVEEGREVPTRSSQ